MSLNEGRECALGDLRIEMLQGIIAILIYVFMQYFKELASSGSWSDRPAEDIQEVVVACTQYLP